MSENASSRRSALISAVFALFVARGPRSTKEAASDASMLWPRPQPKTLKRPSQTGNTKRRWEWRGAGPYAYMCICQENTREKLYTHTQTLLQIIHIDVYVFRNAACMYLGIPMAYMFSQITVCTYHRQKWQYTESKYIEILNPVFWAWAITIFSESKQRSSRWSRPMKWRSVRNRVAGWEVKPSHPNWY